MTPRTLLALPLALLALTLLAHTASALPATEEGCARLQLRDDSTGASWHLKVTTDATVEGADAACTSSTFRVTAGGDRLALNCEWTQESLGPANPNFVKIYALRVGQDEAHGDGTANWADAHVIWSGTSSLGVADDCDSDSDPGWYPPRDVGHYRLAIRACDDTACDASGWDVNTDDGGRPGSGRTVVTTTSGLIDVEGIQDPLTVTTDERVYYAGESLNISILSRDLDGSNLTGEAANIRVSVYRNNDTWLTSLTVQESQRGGYYVWVRIPDAAPTGPYVVQAWRDAGGDVIEPALTSFRVRSTSPSTLETKIDDLLARLTTTRANNLDNLDTTVSSRLASSSYTAPDNAGITDAVTYSRRGWDASVYGNTQHNQTTHLTAKDVWTHTSRTLTGDQNMSHLTASDVWNHGTRTLTSSLDPSASEIATSVWTRTGRELTSGANLSNLTATDVWAHTPRTLTGSDNFSVLPLSAWADLNETRANLSYFGPEILENTNASGTHHTAFDRALGDHRTTTTDAHDTHLAHEPTHWVTQFWDHAKPRTPEAFTLFTLGAATLAAGLTPRKWAPKWARSQKWSRRQLAAAGIGTLIAYAWWVGLVG